ncbi:MAG: acyltransferase [Rhizobiales bacterium]|nr:acyltransferase [Hyphomicrobiales bacterium]
MQKVRVEILDLLRFTAAAAVLMFHFTFRGYAADDMSNLAFPILGDWFKYGYLGVDLFFIISGFVIAFSAENRSATQFLSARASRIYPAFVLCASITALTAYFIGTSQYAVSLNQYLANLLIAAPVFGQSFVDGAYWSIMIELVFYGWMFMLILLNQMPRIREIMMGWLAIAMLNQFALHSSILEILFVTQYAGHFILGILSYLVYRDRADKSDYMMIAAAFVFSLATAFKDSAEIGLYYQTLLSPLVIGAWITAFTVFFVLLKYVPAPRLPSRAYMVIGAITYPLYLLHQNIGFMLINQLEGSMNRYMVLGTVITMIVMLAYLVWRFLERPLALGMRNGLNVLFARLPFRFLQRPAQEM